MRNFLIVIAFLLSSYSFAQNKRLDSLKAIYHSAKHDTTRVNALNELSLVLAKSNPDSALVVANNALVLAKKIGFKRGEILAEYKIGRVFQLMEIPEQTMLQFNRVIELGNAMLSKQNRPDLISIKKLLGNAFCGLGTEYEKQGDLPKAIESCQKGLKLAIETDDKPGMSKIYADIGRFYQYQADFSTALEYYRKGLKIAESAGERKMVAKYFCNIGGAFRDQADYPKSLEYYFKGLKEAEKIGDKYLVGTALSGVAVVYADQGDSPRALEYNFKALKIMEEFGDKRLAGLILGNIAVLYQESQENFTKGLEYNFKALKLAEEAQDIQGVAVTLINIAVCYVGQGDSAVAKGNNSVAIHDKYPKALEYYFKGIAIAEKIGDVLQVGLTLGNIGSIYIKLGEYKKAEPYLKKALTISKEIGAANLEKDHYNFLSYLYEKDNRPALALENYKKYIALRDSIFSQENSKKLMRTEMDHEYEKQKLVAEAKFQTEIEKQKAVAEEKSRKQKVITYSVTLGLVLVILLAIFIYRSNRQKQKDNKIITLQKLEVESQKLLIEEKHKEITDSINYAERIQRSFLASKELLDDHLSGRAGAGIDDGYFVFFQPKDVVSGDFYWASTLTGPNGEESFALVTADSTGHGVPGAIMSLLNITSLEAAIKDGWTNPADILDATRKTIIERLKKDGSEQGGKDGMDASVICFDFPNRKFTYASANNPVWVVRPSNEHGTMGNLIELSPDKMPVGKHEKDTQPFTQHEFAFEKGDVVYTLTDGMPDQFGGPKGKKFKYKQLKELLVSISLQPMNIQKDLLSDALKSWKGNYEQVDDICVIGVRV